MLTLDFHPCHRWICAPCLEWHWYKIFEGKKERSWIQCSDVGAKKCDSHLNVWSCWTSHHTFWASKWITCKTRKEGYSVTFFKPSFSNSCLSPNEILNERPACQGNCGWGGVGGTLDSCPDPLLPWEGPWDISDELSRLLGIQFETQQLCTWGPLPF